MRTILISIFLVIFPLSRIANGQVQIQYGQYIAGNINSIGKVEVYEFSGNAGEHFTLRVQSFGNEYFNSRVELYNPSGTIDTVGWDSYNDAFGRGIQQVSFIDRRLKATGIYTIYVTENAGSNTSQYWLNLQSREQISASARVISYNTYLSDTISKNGNIKGYKFSGNAGEHFTLRVQSFGNEYFNSRVELYNPSGTIDTVGWDSYNDAFGRGIQQVSFIDRRLKATGIYTIYVTENAGSNTSQYWLNLQSREQISASARVISYNTYLSDTISKNGNIKGYKFSGNAGEHFTLRVQSFGNEYFNSRVELYNPSGTIDTVGWDSYNDAFGRGIQQVSFIDRRLKATGIYTIYVTENAGSNTSQYWLNLQSREQISASARVISYNTYLSDTISKNGNIKGYKFSGNAGEHFTLRVQSFGNEYFNSKVELYNPSGTIDTVGWDSYNDAFGRGIQQVSFIDRRLKATGIYTIYVTENAGSNTSQYWLNLQSREQISASARVISYNTYLSDTISKNGNIKGYKFSGNAGEHFTLRVQSFGNEYFNSKVELYNPSGTIDTVGWDSYNDAFGRGIRQVSFIDRRLKATGIYTIYVTENAGSNTSQYWLNLQSREQISASARVISYNTYLSDTISKNGNIKGYKFSGNAGEHFTLRVQSFGNEYFNSRVELYNPSGTIDTVGWDSYNDAFGRGIQQVSFIDRRLKATGIYTIYVTENAGKNASQYWLSLQCWEDLLAKSDTLKTRTGSRPVILDKFGNQKAFIFLVNKEDSTVLKIIRKSGNAEPHIELFNGSGSLLLTAANSIQLDITDQIFTTSGLYILIIGDNNGDATGTFELSWDGIVTNLIYIDEIFVPDSIVSIHEDIKPRVKVSNIGWEKQTFSAKFKVFNIYSDSITSLSLVPQETDTIEFKTWTPDEAAAYKITCSAIVENIFSNRKSKTVAVSKGFGPEIYNLDPQTGENGGIYTLSITGNGFQQKLKIVLFNASFPDIVADSSNIVFVDSQHIKVTFDFTDVPQSMFNLKVINPDGNEYTFYEAFNLKQFNGSIIEFDRWQEVAIPLNSKKKYGVNVPEKTVNLFFLVRKSTKIGHHGTWTGNIRIFRQGTLICEKSGMEDFDLQIKNAVGGRYYVEILANDDAKAQIKVCDNLDSLKLGDWHKGIVLKGWGHDWTQVDIPVNMDTLFFETQGFGIYSNMNIYLDSLTNRTAHWYFDNYKNGFHLKGKIPKPKAGRYIFKYEDSDNVEGRTSQERDYLLNVDIKTISISPGNQKPVITELSTYTVGQGLATIEVFGRGFLQIDSTIMLFNDNNLVRPYNTLFDSLGSKWIVEFDLTGINIGSYTLKILQNSGNSLLAPAKVRIVERSSLNIAAKILSRSQVRINRIHSLMIRFENLGNVDQYLIPVDVVLPRGNLVYQENKENWPFIKLTDFINDWPSGTFYPPIEILPINGIEQFNIHNPEKYMIIPFLLRKLSVGETLTIEIPILFDQIFQDKISVYISNPIIDQVFSNYSKGGPIDCLVDYTKLVQKIGFKIFGVGAAESCIVGFGNVIMDVFRNISTDKYVHKLVPYTYIPSSLLPLIVKCLEAAGSTNPYSKIGYMIYEIYDAIKTVKEFSNDCKNLPGDLADMMNFGAVSSSTPEDKYGTTGFGIGGNISKDQKLTYRVDFWNHEKATAPAQQVFIKDTLNTNLNDTTFSFTEFGFLRWKVPLKAGTYFNVNVDMRPDMNLIVNAEGKYDYKSREISCTLQSLNPATMELTDEPLEGFLPPIDSTGYQIGWVEYQIQPNKNLASGAVIPNRAWVNFEGVGPTNPAPKGAPWINTIDDTPPESCVDNLPIVVFADYVLVNWQGTDIGSGIGNYNIYVSEDNSDYKLWLSSTSDESQYFFGEKGKTYYFYSIAKDRVGLIEKPKYVYEAMVKFDPWIGINDITYKPFEGKLLIYPNPAQCCFRVISGLNCTTPKTITLFNDTGMKVMEKKFNTDEITVDLSNFGKGIYYVNVKCGNVFAYEKIVLY